MTFEQWYQEWLSKTVTCVMCQGKGWQKRYGSNYNETYLEECRFCHGTARVTRDRHQELLR